MPFYCVLKSKHNTIHKVNLALKKHNLMVIYKTDIIATSLNYERYVTMSIDECTKQSQQSRVHNIIEDSSSIKLSIICKFQVFLSTKCEHNEVINSFFIFFSKVKQAVCIAFKNLLHNSIERSLSVN